MKVYRSQMEKILDRQENDTIITDPKQPVRTFIRKMKFVFSVWNEKLRSVFKSKA